MSTLLALIAIVVALGVGAVYGQPYLSSGEAPTWITSRIDESATTTTSIPDAGVDHSIDGITPSLRAGRHADFDRIVLSGVNGCFVDADDTWADDAGTWIHIRCERSLAALSFDVDRPVDAGLVNVLDWETGDGTELVLLVEHATSATVDTVGTTGGRWVFDIRDAA